MATEIVIPKLGMTMEKGTLAEWHVADGQEVQAGEFVFHLETEKIEMEVEAEAAGIVRQAVPNGTTLPPGAVVGFILAPGEEMPKVAAPAAVPVAEMTPAGAVDGARRAAASVTLEGGRIPSSPIARRLAKEAGIDLALVAGTGPNGRIVEADVLAAKAAPLARAPRRAGLRPQAPVPARDVIASPLARRLAERLRVDLATVPGTGPGGRVTMDDVEQAAGAAPAAAAGPPPSVYRPGEAVAIRGMRRVIAERMHASLREMAQLTMGMDVAMGAAVELRGRLVEQWAPDGVRPTYTDLVVKALALALRLHPRVNAEFGEAEIRLHDDVHIGLAVAVEEGLLVPVIRDADLLSLREIAAESSRLAGAAREGRLMPDDMAGQTFSVTTLGASGVDFFTPIINPPNAGILGVGQIRDGVTWDGDRPLKTPMMTLSLTIDHRAIDGAPAAAFLGTVRDLLESPYRLLS